MDNKKKKKEKYFWRIINIMLAFIMLLFFLFIWQVIGMLDDHQCWIDGYHSDHCQKYVRGNE